MTTVLAIDQGTSGTKAVLVDEHGEIVARGSAPVGARFPHPGWVEQDAEELWRSALVAIERCLEHAPGARPVALAVSNQRESAVVWHRANGDPAGPVIGWQDGRTAKTCERLRADGAEDLVRARTGLALDPMFSATKLRWLLERAPSGTALCAGTVDAWLVWRLTGGEVFACEAGNASRTQLMDLRTATWDPELLDLFGVPAAALPEIRPSDGGFGRTVAADALPGDVPIAAVLADSHAALFGHGCSGPGGGKATYGTGTSVMTPVARLGEPTIEVAQTLAWLTDRPTWALEGNIIATGAALDWLGATLGVGGGPALEALAGEVDDSGGVDLVPAFAGLGAPYWDRDATAVMTGFGLGTRPAHLARAGLECVAHQVCDVLEAMEVAGGPELEVLFADGGASAGALVMQLQADLAGRSVRASTAAEMSALGAAHMAGLSQGIWPDASRLPRPGRTFRPRISEMERHERRAAWRAAVARSRGQVSAR